MTTCAPSWPDRWNRSAIDVIAAASGEEGLGRIVADAPDLALIDYAMPGMTGADVARAARARRPDLPIVFVTGYAESDQLEDALGPDVPVLRKPFTMADLAAALEMPECALGRRERSGPLEPRLEPT